VATLGVVGTAGCSALFGTDSRQPVDPPSIVTDYELRLTEFFRRGDTEGPPTISCINDTTIRVRGHVLTSGDDPVVVDSMSNQNGTFEAVVAVIDKPGSDAGGKPVYEMNVSFSTMPDRIRVVENTSSGTFTEAITC
jgi:hypothetical protein